MFCELLVQNMGVFCLLSENQCNLPLKSVEEIFYVFLHALPIHRAQHCVFLSIFLLCLPSLPKDIEPEHYLLK